MKEITKWLYLSDLDHREVREWINGIWFAMSFCVVVVFGTKLVASFCYMARRHGIRKWFDDIGNRAALPLFFYFLGETMMRGWIWTLLLFQNAGWDATHITEDYIIAMAAATISTLSCLCCIWVFSRSQWAWILSALFIAAFIVFEVYITLWPDVVPSVVPSGFELAPK